MAIDNLERMMALGYGMGKKIYKGEIFVRRWINTGDEIEFTNPEFWSDNVEFQINNNQNCKLWLSQLQGLFVNEDFTKIGGSVLNMKDGNQLFINNISCDDFWDIVKNKKFTAVVDEKFFLRINWEWVIEKGFSSKIDQLLPFISSCLKTGDYQAISGVTEEHRCYNLSEI